MFQVTSEHAMFPNPSPLVDKDDMDAHFYFLGIVLGKMLYDGQLMEARFARFFLNKLLGRAPMVDDLASLDPQFHRNLLFLKGYEGDLEDIGVTFAVTVDEYG